MKKGEDWRDRKRSLAIEFRCTKNSTSNPSEMNSTLYVEVAMVFWSLEDQEMGQLLMRIRNLEIGW